MGHEKIFSRKNTLSQYSERTYIESGDVKGKRPKDLRNGNGSAPPPPPTTCPLDIVIAVDLSGSTLGPGSTHPTLGNLNSAIIWSGHPGSPYEAERKLLEDLIDYLTPGMLAGEIQVGVVFYAQHYPISLDPDGFSMSSDPYGDLCTNSTPHHPCAIQEPGYATQQPSQGWHSRIAYKMWQAYTGLLGSIGNGTDIGYAMDAAMRPHMVGTPPMQGQDIGVLHRKFNSDFASQYPVRNNDPDFRQVCVVITDSANPPGATSGYPLSTGGLPITSGIPPQFAPWPGTTISTRCHHTGPWECCGGASTPQEGHCGCFYQSSSLLPAVGSAAWWPAHTISGGANLPPLAGPVKQYVIGIVALDGNFANLPATGLGSQENVKWTLDAITCGQNSGSNGWNTSLQPGSEFGYYVDISDPASIATVGAAVIGQACVPVGAPATYICSGTSTTLIDRYNMPVGAWTCYDDGSGTNNPSQTLCEDDCPPESYNCTNAPLWMCLDPGNGLGHFSVANNYPNTIPNQTLINACEDDCYEESYNCNASSSPITLPLPIGTVAPWNCYDPLDGTGQYTDANQGGIPGAGSAACQTNCNAPIPESYNCSGAGGAIDSLGNIVAAWECWDPLDGSGTYTSTPTQTALQACEEFCPQESWSCNSSSGQISTLSGQLVQPWSCYDPGNGLGTYGVGPFAQTFCINHGCNAPKPDSWDCNDPNNPAVYTPALPDYYCFDPGTGLGQFTNWNDCHTDCVAPPPESYSCSGPHGVSLAAGTPPHPIFGMNIPPWKCFDTGMGTGHFIGINALTDCEAGCPLPSWDCNDPNDPTVYNPALPNYSCNDPGNGLGFYTTQGACTAACNPPPESYNCSGPFGVSVINPLIAQLYPPTGTIPPWECWDPLDGSGTYSVAHGHLSPLISCRHECREPGWSCDEPNCIGPIPGGQYPSLADCLVWCGNISVGVFCNRIISCPCGWNSVALGNVYNCELSDASGLLTTMPAIERCMGFPNPDPTGNPLAPQIGDIWEHQDNFGGYSWIAAVVVDNSMQTTSTTSLEQYTTC